MVSGTGCVSDRAVGSGALLGGRGSLPDRSSSLPSGSGTSRRLGRNAGQNSPEIRQQLQVRETHTDWV